MEKREIIPASEFCIYHSISWSFIAGLQEAGLVEIDTVENEHYLYVDQLKTIEPLVRMHTELEINIEGIEAIAHLLQRVENMQHEMQLLKQRLGLYEDDI
ncbi:MAG: hypothetical protein BGO70_12085 [Bacteroidetes bacterium 43-93]|nr:MerR family transcriptional regulator [Bacteroidota bacterium]OJW98195.1 MAG: hypothetical protein BGO70_12085 [Bacteroidetes bacterium 43-93]